jgi:drug/metabolite transporter (DMT)-like permease
MDGESISIYHIIGVLIIIAAIVLLRAQPAQSKL